MNEHDGYQGPATLTAGNARVAIEVWLRGHFQPIDGRYHWYGRIEPHDGLPGLVRTGRLSAVLTTPQGSARCVVSDPDPWQRYRVTGISTPPFVADMASPAAIGETSPVPGPLGPLPRTRTGPTASPASPRSGPTYSGSPTVMGYAAASIVKQP